MDNVQADFFIEQHIRAKSLALDTLSLGKENRDLYGIINEDSEQIDYLAQQIEVKDTLIDRRDKFVVELNKKYTKEQRRTKFYKNTTVIFLSTTTILILMAVLLIK